MSLKLFEIIHELEAIAHPSLQESYDNSGLLVGDKNAVIHAALVCLDCTEDVVNEAIKKMQSHYCASSRYFWRFKKTNW